MAPIYVPENEGTSLTDLIRAVRMRLGDFPQKRKQSEISDGSTANYRLKGKPYEDDGVTATVAGYSAVQTMDYDSGWISLSAFPDASDEVVFYYSTVVWTDERITEAINASIDGLFGQFYVIGTHDDIQGNGTNEFEVTTSGGFPLSAGDRIIKVEKNSSSNMIRLKDWSVHSTATKKYVHLANATSSSDVIRVTYAARPKNLVYNLPSWNYPTETLEGTAGLPTRAKEPIVCYSTASLMRERLSTRAMDDRYTQDQNNVRLYEVLNVVNALELNAEMQLRKLRMSPLFVRS